MIKQEKNYYYQPTNCHLIKVTYTYFIFFKHLGMCFHFYISHFCYLYINDNLLPKKKDLRNKKKQKL